MNFSNSRFREHAGDESFGNIFENESKNEYEMSPGFSFNIEMDDAFAFVLCLYALYS